MIDGQINLHNNWPLTWLSTTVYFLVWLERFESSYQNTRPRQRCSYRIGTIVRNSGLIILWNSVLPTMSLWLSPLQWWHWMTGSGAPKLKFRMMRRQNGMQYRQQAPICSWPDIPFKTGLPSSAWVNRAARVKQRSMNLRWSRFSFRVHWIWSELHDLWRCTIFLGSSSCSHSSNSNRIHCFFNQPSFFSLGPELSCNLDIKCRKTRCTIHKGD